MAKLTRVERGLYWERAWSLVSGCKHVSDGCHFCWSEREAGMRIHNPNPKISERFKGVVTESGKWNSKIKMLEENLELPLRISKPTIFSIWTDLFHEYVSIKFIDSVLEVIAACPHHTFLALTKRPENIGDMLWGGSVLGGGDYLKNLWLGITAENQEMLKNRMPYLARIKEAIPKITTFLSYEPALRPIDIYPDHHFNENTMRWEKCAYFAYLDWVIIGAESGGPKERRIENHHITDLLLQCSDLKVPVFLKQAWIDNKLVKMPNLGGQVWDQFPRDLERS